jgi:hypothetical protein
MTERGVEREKEPKNSGGARVAKGVQLLARLSLPCIGASLGATAFSAGLPVRLVHSSCA